MSAIEEMGRAMIRNRVTLALAVTAVAACNGPPAEIPSSEALMPINGTELYVKRMGAGEPIIVVHGGPMLEHGYLLPYLAPLAESYELIFYDQRLSGRSAGTVDSSSVRLATFVDDIEALRQALDLGPVHLMAHSWGGLLALHYAVRYGENLRSLVLLSSMSASSALWRQEEEALAERITAEDRAEQAAIMETEAFANREPAAVVQLLRASYKVQFHDRAVAGQLDIYVPDDYAERSRQFGYMTEDLLSYDIHDSLARVTVPTLILYGADEPGAELGGEALHEHLQRSWLMIVGDAGHFPFVEQPQGFLSVVRGFLEDRQ